MTAVSIRANDSILGTLLARLQEHTGLDFPESRMGSAQSAIGRVLAQISGRDIAQLATTLETDETLFDALVEAVTVGETYFFRDPRQLAFLREHAIPDILHHRAEGHVLRAWSAGCASGEEPYSLAILCDQLGLGARRRIVGTDISRSRLAIARSGRYGRWSLRGVAPEIVDRYFLASQLRYELVPTIRDAVRFEYLNLASEIPLEIVSGGQDLIVCRNVLIYLDGPTIARVGRAFMERLADGGWLLLGPSDPPLPDTRSCEVVITDAGLAYRRGRKARGLPLRVTPHFMAVQPGIPEPVAPAIPAQAVGASRALVPATSSPETAVDAGDTCSAQRLDALKLRAKRSLESRDYATGVELVRRYLSDRPADEEGWIILVRALSNGGRVNDAAVSCAAALELHPLSAELMVLQSLILAELGEHGAALAASRRALYLDRELAVAHLACGSASIRIGDARSARRAFTNALRLLASSATEEAVRASGGELPARLAMMARTQLRLLDEAEA